MNYEKAYPDLAKTLAFLFKTHDERKRYKPSTEAGSVAPSCSSSNESPDSRAEKPITAGSTTPANCAGADSKTSATTIAATTASSSSADGKSTPEPNTAGKRTAAASN